MNDCNWRIHNLVVTLNWLVGWHLLMEWCVGWFAELMCWLTLTDALTWWLMCWVGVFFLTLTDALACLLCVESTCWFFNCFSRCNRGLLRFFIKETRKKELHIHYLFKVDWKQTSFCCAVRWNKKTRHGLNRGMMYYIPVKQALKRI